MIRYFLAPGVLPMRVVAQWARGLVPLLLLMTSPMAGAKTVEEIHGFEPRFVCPPGVAVANIKTDFGAVGDGVTDDTGAFLEAFGGDQPRTIFLPAGTYLVREQLRYGVNAAKKKRVCVIGESRSSTVIKLADHSPGFGDPQKPRAFIHARHPDQQGEQNMHNYLYHLTIEIGRGNPGAVGLNFHSNNTGAVKDVTIRSADPVNHLGHTGLACTDWEVGPANARYITVEGFRTGIALTRVGNYFTLEHATVRNCHTGLVCGTASIRDLSIEGCGLPVQCEGQVVLLDSTLRGQGEVAIDNAEGTLLARNVRAEGFDRLLRKGEIVGRDIGQFVGGPLLSNWKPATEAGVSLGLPVEESPEVQYPQSSEDWAVMPAGSDISEPLQRAIDSGKEHIYVQGGAKISRTIQLRNKVRRIMGLGVVMARYETGDAPVFRLEDGDAPQVIIELLYGGYGSNSGFTFEQASTRTLVARHGSGSYRTASGGRGGKIFIESLVGYPFLFNDVQAWVRDLNTEHGGADAANVVNNGGVLWLMGHKTEDFATKIKMVNGSSTELLGGTYRQNWGRDDFDRSGIDPGDRPPLFVIEDSAASLSYVAWGPGLPYVHLVRETRKGETRNLERSAHGSDATLFVAAQGRVRSDR